MSASSSPEPQNDGKLTQQQHQVQTNQALGECLFSQFILTTVAVAGVTGYAVYKKPKNGLALLCVVGGAGTVADLLYGWNVACSELATDFRQRRMQAYIQKHHLEGIVNANNYDNKTNIKVQQQEQQE